MHSAGTRDCPLPALDLRVDLIERKDRFDIVLVAQRPLRCQVCSRADRRDLTTAPNLVLSTRRTIRDRGVLVEKTSR
jgi:hypothetical protein